MGVVHSYFIFLSLSHRSFSGWIQQIATVYLITDKRFLLFTLWQSAVDSEFPFLYCHWPDLAKVSSRLENSTA